MLYRRQGGLVWYNGELENVSVSGILFRGEKPLVSGDVAQISFWLPASQGHQEPTQVFCWARVVRVLLPQMTEAQHTLAVKIFRYRAEPVPPPDIRDVVRDARGPIRQPVNRPPSETDRLPQKRAA